MKVIYKYLHLVLAEFIKEHIKSVGQEQAIKDFQTGLNLLTGYKKETVLEEQIQLEEDADCLGLLAVQNFALHFLNCEAI